VKTSTSLPGMLLYLSCRACLLPQGPSTKTLKAYIALVAIVLGSHALCPPLIAGGHKHSGLRLLSDWAALASMRCRRHVPHLWLGLWLSTWKSRLGAACTDVSFSAGVDFGAGCTLPFSLCERPQCTVLPALAEALGTGRQQRRLTHSPCRVLHRETVRLIRRLHQFDVMRANKAPFAFGLEPRVPFLDKAFLDTSMTIDPTEKMVRPVETSLCCGCSACQESHFETPVLLSCCRASWARPRSAAALDLHRCCAGEAVFWICDTLPAESGQKNAATQ
jgi:hypothetical protein